MPIVFKINIQSFSNIVTNSSSELFVFVDDNLDFVEELLNKIAPNWKDEYELKRAIDCNEDELETLIDNIALPNIEWSSFDSDTIEEQLKKYDDAICHYFLREWGIDEEEVPSLFDNWDEPIVDKTPNGTFSWFYLQPSYKMYEEFKRRVKYDVTLWSYNDNPDWDTQQKISKYAQRYHLG